MTAKSKNCYLDSLIYSYNKNKCLYYSYFVITFHWVRYCYAFQNSVFFSFALFHSIIAISHSLSHTPFCALFFRFDSIYISIICLEYSKWLFNQMGKSEEIKCKNANAKEIKNTKAVWFYQVIFGLYVFNLKKIFYDVFQNKSVVPILLVEMKIYCCQAQRISTHQRKKKYFNTLGKLFWNRLQSFLWCLYNYFTFI